MSILIRGMDMPMSCESCQFRRCISNLIMFSWVGCQLDVGIEKKNRLRDGIQTARLSKSKPRMVGLKMLIKF